MNRTRLISAGIVGGCAVGALLLTLYFLLSQPGRESHEEYLTGDTVFRLVTQPAMEQGYISSLTNAATKYITRIPRFTSMQARAFRVDAIHTLPYELSLLIDTPPGAPPKATLFMNTIPESEGFISEANQPGFLGALGFVSWGGRGFDAPSEHVFLAKGEFNAPALTAQPPGIPPPLALEHFAELSADNRSGVLEMFHVALLQSGGAFIDPALHDALLALWPSVSFVQGHMDREADDDMSIGATIELAGGADQNAALALLQQAHMILAEWFLTHDVQWEGRWEAEGPLKIFGECHLRGFEQHIRRRLGG